MASGHQLRATAVCWQERSGAGLALPEEAAATPAAAAALLPSSGCIFEVGDFLTSLFGEC